MSGRKPTPGGLRGERIGDAGLQRLEAQLRRGSCPADAVLKQWLRRYGDEARSLLQRYERYRQELEP